jgi:hypothetical protein
LGSAPVSILLITNRPRRSCHPQAAFTNAGSLSCSRLLHGLPSDVGEERLDVGRSLCRFVIKQIRVFPHIHDEEGNEPRYMPMFMKTNPMVGKTAARWIQGAHSPTHTSHLSHAGKVQFPHVIGAETVFRSFQKRRALIGFLRDAVVQVLKVVFVQDHPVMFKSQPSSQFGIGLHFFMINPSVFEPLANLGRQLVHALHISLIELEMHLECPVRNPDQSM